MYNLARFDSPHRSVILLAPRNPAGPAFRNVCCNQTLHDRLQGEMQRLRGSIYLRDGAIRQSDLTPDGRHELLVDSRSWHLLLMDEQGSIGGCARYLKHPASVGFDDLLISRSALVDSGEWRLGFQSAIEGELDAARRLGFSYVEMGGWAMADHFRGTSECLRSMLASYAWLRLIGGALAVCPATERNGSAAILRRMGGRLLEWAGNSIPSYFDGRYGCAMQMLRFDSRTSIPRYEQTVQQLMNTLAAAPVICAGAADRFAPKTDFRTQPSRYPVAAGALAATA